MPKVIKGQAHVPTEQEFKRLLKVIAQSKHPKRDLLLIYMSFGLGLRAVELAALKIKDVLKENGQVNEVIKLQRTKNNKPRPVYLPDKSEDSRIHDALIDYVNYRKAYSEKKRAPFSFSQPLFLSQKRAGFTNKGMQKLFERIYKECGLVGCSSHSGRRTFATNLIEQGVDIKAVSTLMGHATVAMTAQYVENNPHRLRKIAAKALY
jgi:integrase/recombinase XerD